MKSQACEPSAQIVTATASSLPDQPQTLARGRAFAEPLIASEVLGTGENTLVHADAVLVEHFSRQPESWLFREYSGVEASVHLASIDCTVALKDVYEGVIEPPA